MALKRRLIIFLGIFSAVLLGFLLAWFRGPFSLSAQSPVGPPGDGLKFQILSARIDEARKPEVTFRLTDAAGRPLALSDLDPLAGAPALYTIAKLRQDEKTGLTEYVNYIINTVPGRPFVMEGKTVQPALASATQPGVDSGGSYSDQGGGTFVYTFRTALPADFDWNSTHRIGGQVSRAARKWVGNDVIDFMPSGAPVAGTRDLVKTESCNRCHDPLAIHGGTRRDTRFCVTCHTSQNTDPESGNTVEFKVMIHKIHRGEHLPSVEAGKPYVIVGFGQNVFNFGEVVWPQDVRNCETCHTGPQGANWKNAPNNAACTACHDNVNANTGVNHPGGAQPDSACKTCHTPDGPEFGLSVSGAHTLPTRSTQVPGVKFQIVRVANTAPGQSPTVLFNIKDNQGNPIAPAEMNSLSLMFAGPTTDYVNRWQEAATGAAPAGDGNYSYTFQAKIPADAVGSFAVGIEGYKNRTVQGVRDPVRDAGFNEIAYIAVTDPVPMPRKTIVDRNGCNQCHEDLGNPAGMSIHGGIRRNPQYCIMCHNTTRTDEEGRPQELMPPESVHFKRLIHRIHTGEEQSEPFIIYRIMSGVQRIYDFSHIRFPGDRRNCEKCHVPGSQLLPFLHSGAQPTVITQKGQVVETIGAITSACTACHDSRVAKGHASLQTTSKGVETCVVCHNEGREFAVSKVHAR